MVISRIKPVSCAKIAGILYAMLGIVLGGVISLIALSGGFGSTAPSGPGTPAFVRMIGASAIFVAPIFYGCLGFVMTLIGAALYNFVAGMVGGIEIETQ